VQTGAGPGGGDAIYPAAGLAGEGTVGGRHVRCLTPELQLVHHCGYAPLPKDRHNVRVLCEHFNLQAPRSYRE
jgi:lincosamide nucleotidyltransferase A/C/D/E